MATSVKRVVIETDSETYRKVKLTALLNDMTMKEFVRCALEKYIAEKEQEGK